MGKVCAECGKPLVGVYYGTPGGDRGYCCIEHMPHGAASNIIDKEINKTVLKCDVTYLLPSHQPHELTNERIAYETGRKHGREKGYKEGYNSGVVDGESAGDKAIEKLAWLKERGVVVD